MFLCVCAFSVRRGGQFWPATTLAETARSQRACRCYQLAANCLITVIHYHLLIVLDIILYRFAFIDSYLEPALIYDNAITCLPVASSSGVAEERLAIIQLLDIQKNVSY